LPLRQAAPSPLLLGVAEIQAVPRHAIIIRYERRDGIPFVVVVVVVVDRETSFSRLDCAWELANPRVAAVLASPF